MRIQIIARALPILALAGMIFAAPALAQSSSGERALLNQVEPAAVELAGSTASSQELISGERALLNQVGTAPAAALAAGTWAIRPIDPERALLGRTDEPVGFPVTAVYGATRAR